MKKLLWVGDAACPSGFARATHEILNVLRHKYDIVVLGINYNGDPHEYPYPIFACYPGGDAFGIGRIVWMCNSIKPDVIVIQNDGWNIPFYMQQLAKSEHKDIPVVAAVAVDGKNFNGRWLDGVSLAIFWTRFAFNEARQGGYAGEAAIIPLGVDTKIYYPCSKREARKARSLDQILDAFIVGNVNRNQPRKRWDLTIKYFAEWVKSYNIQDAWLYLHVAPTGDTGVDVVRLASYYGIGQRLVLMETDTFYGLSEDDMRNTYNSFDVQVTTTQGEGFGLPTFEGMACGIPQIVPDWAALGELTAGAVLQVPCLSTAIGPPYKNVIGGVVDEAKFIEALHVMRCNKIVFESMARAGLDRAREDRFHWSNVGVEWVRAIGNLLNPVEEVWPEQKVIGQIGVRT